MTSIAADRAGGRRLMAGVFWNAAGRGLPLLLALVLTPVLVTLLGVERWGLFTLALAMVGVFGIFDLGVGQALTRALSERIGEGRGEEATGLVGAAFATLGLVSLLGAAAIWFLVPPLVEKLLNVPAAMQTEAVSAMRVLALAAPLVVINAALWGVLAAYQRFRAANLVTIPVSIFYYLGPVLTLLVWDSLIGVMLALVACRFANTLSYAWLVRPLLPGLSWRGLRLRLVLPLLRIGGWMSLSGALTQALLYADRFLVGALLTLAAVAYYATPLDLVLRMWVLPVAVAQALMPAIASGFRTLPLETAGLLRRGALLILLGVVPACLLLAGFAPDILRLWLGTDFAEGGAGVLRILAVGILFSCAGFAPGTLIDAIGRPDVTARFSLAQAALFLPLSAMMLIWLGIEGAAIAWTLRAMADCFGRMLLAARLYPASSAAARRLAPVLIASAAAVIVTGLMPSYPAILAAGMLGFALFAAMAFFALLPAERAGLRNPRALLRGAT